MKKKAAFLICRASSIWSMLQPPRIEEAASFSYMQHQPLTLRWRRLFFWYAKASGIYDAASKKRRCCLFLLYAASASYSMIKKAAFLICKGLGNLWCSLQEENTLPLSLICSFSLLQYDKEDCFSQMQRSRLSGYAAASKERRGCPFLWYASSASYSMIKKTAFLICRDLWYVGYAAASKEWRGCLFLLHAALASYSMICK